MGGNHWTSKLGEVAEKPSSAQNWPALEISELTMVSSKVDISFKEDVFRHKSGSEGQGKDGPSGFHFLGTGFGGLRSCRSFLTPTGALSLLYNVFSGFSLSPTPGTTDTPLSLYLNYKTNSCNTQKHKIKLQKTSE